MVATPRKRSVRTGLALLVIAAACAAATASQSRIAGAFVQTPFGSLLPRCVHTSVSHQLAREESRSSSLAVRALPHTRSLPDAGFMAAPFQQGRHMLHSVMAGRRVCGLISLSPTSRAAVAPATPRTAVRQQANPSAIFSCLALEQVESAGG